MTNEQRDEWAAAVLDRIRLHRRHDVSGLLSMLDDDLADCFDCLAVAPLLVDARVNDHDEYEMRRLAHLHDYKIDWRRIEREEARNASNNPLSRPVAAR